MRDLSGTAEYEVTVGYELSHWSTDARSVLLVGPSADGRAFATMALPGGDVRPLDLRLANLSTEVAFVVGRELAVFDGYPWADQSGTQELTVTLKDVHRSVNRRLTVIGPGQLRPGEALGPLIALWRAGGNPPSIWMEVGQTDLVPTDSPEGSLVLPSVALLGVDVTSGAPLGRIELTSTNVDGRQLCVGVVAEGVVLQRWTASATELIVVDPRRGTRRVVTRFPENVNVLVPGARL
ncbi:hypothetical protein GCM10027614_21750 [Micromonospora vulcania]